MSSEVKMILVEIFKKVFRESGLTGFKVFRDYLFILLKASGFDILSEDFFSRPSSRLKTSVMTAIPLIGLISSSCVICKYFRNIEELITGSISFIMILQLGSKLVELVVNRNAHRDMLATVEKNTQALEKDPELCNVGINNFKRARLFISCSTVCYIAALISLVLYPIVTFLVTRDYKLSANLELPGTNNKDPVGWLVNYLFSILLVTLTCFPILGEVSTLTCYAI